MLYCLDFGLHDMYIYFEMDVAADLRGNYLEKSVSIKEKRSLSILYFSRFLNNNKNCVSSLKKVLEHIKVMMHLKC